MSAKRWNQTGLPRNQLLWALTQRHVIQKALAEGRCLLCKEQPINEASLCEICWALLSDKELNLASKWLRGDGP